MPPANQTAAEIALSAARALEDAIALIIRMMDVDEDIALALVTAEQLFGALYMLASSAGIDLEDCPPPGIHTEPEDYSLDVDFLMALEINLRPNRVAWERFLYVHGRSLHRHLLVMQGVLVLSVRC